jgi:acyl transferase domain-containing protein
VTTATSSTTTTEVSTTEVLSRALGEIRELRAALEAAGPALGEPVAIIGMACRMPGAPDLAAFWELLRAGRDATGPIPADRFDGDEYYDPDPAAPGRSRTRRGAFLDGVDRFDPGFFSISPREAARMDPQQRLFLEVAWEALEHAGRPAGSAIAKAGGTADSTGIFLGVTGFDYSHQVLAHSPLRALDPYALTGVTSTFAAGRLAHWLGVQGPALSVDTACSSSLVAAHLAVRSLQAGDCDVALAGGVNILLSPEWFVVLSKAGMLAPDGRCKTFDASADGYARGEGCGVVVLKRLADAEADGDRIMAVIRGSAVNQDGRSSGITVPNGSAQRAVLREALRRSGLSGGEVDYVEAHGTGTSLGDPIEVHALAEVYGAGREPERPLVVGSVKTNIGHLEPAAGIAGLIKTVLMLRHSQIPPLLHLKQVNPEIPLAELPITLPTTLTDWPRGQRPRLAAVSSFGASGTNAHMIVGEPPEPGQRESTADRPEHLVCLSARTRGALSELAAGYAESMSNLPDGQLADAAFTANAGRAHFPYRMAVRSRTTSELRARLAAHAECAVGTDGLHTTGEPGKARPKVAFLFTGQGSQYPGMGRELFEAHPGFRRDLEHCDALARGLLDRPLLDLLFNGRPAEINQTGYTQPVLFALQYALARLWRGWGVEPAAVLGHSVGEYAAACAAGVFSVDDGLRLIAERARLMQNLPAGGGMLALRIDADRAARAVQDHPDTLSVAAINGPHSVVVAGTRPALDELAGRMTADGVKISPLQVSHAFHSPLLDPMLDEFEQKAAEIAYAPPRIPFISNLTGEPVGRSSIDPRYLRDHARRPVRFRDGLDRLAQRGCRVFVEIGPTPVLCGMAKDTITDQAAAWLPSLRPQRGAWETMLDALGRLYTLGVDVDWAGFDREYPRRRIELPHYPFQRTRHWLTQDAVAPSPAAFAAHTAAVARQAPEPQPEPALPGIHVRRLPSPLGPIQYEAVLAAEGNPGLRENVVDGTPVVNAGFYLEAAVRSAADLFGTDRVQVGGLLLPQAMVFPDSGRQLTHLVAEPLDENSAAFHHFAALDETAGTWGMFARGTVSRAAEPDARAPRETLSQIEARCPGALPGSRFYSEVWQQRLYLGHTARWLEQIRVGPGEALARMRPADPGESEPYLIHPGVIDCALQLVLPCVAERQSTPDLLVMLAELDRYTFDPAVLGSLPDGHRLLCHARLREDPASPGSDMVTADISLLTEEGSVVARLTGARLRLARRDDLIRAIRTTPKPWTAPSAATRPAAPAPSARPPRSAADLRGLLVGEVARVLGTAPGDLAPGQPLRELGLDSMMAVELRDAVVRALGVTVPAAVFLDDPTIARLEQSLAPLLSAAAAPAGSPVTERTGPGGMHVVELGDGPAVLFVHGGVFGGMDAWNTQALLADRWRLVVPSRLNYGASATSEHEDYERDGELIAELISELTDELTDTRGTGGVHLVAQSYGTLGAMAAAARMPEAVRSLTLIESAASAVARGAPAVDEYENAMLRLLDQPIEGDALFRAFYRLIDPATRFPDPLPPDLARFAARLRGLRHPWEARPPLDALRDAPFRTLVITGGERPLFEAIGDALAKELDGDRLVIPGGHGTQNVGTAFNDALEEFLRAAEGTATA